MSERLTMRKVREVLRLKFECELSERQIAASCGISKGAVNDYLRRARGAGIGWQLARSMSDAEVEARLFKQLGRHEPHVRAPIDHEWVHRELRRAGVTLQLLWVEYQHAVGSRGDDCRPYQYSQFCDLYAAWRSRLTVSMRQVHRAGEKAFVDYSGKKPCIVDAATGEVREVELFVMVLGASNYTYAEATLTQSLPDFLASHVRAFEYFGVVPQVLVPDQLRSAISGPDRYDPEVNVAYLEMAQHYGMAVLPARPRKPKDKAKVEAGVLVAQRWILACLRNRTFFSIDDLNAAIAELLEQLNSRPFQKLQGCRRSAFECIDRPAMKPLPSTRYERADWKKAKVNVDYHVAFDDRFYSVPHALVGTRIEVRATVSTVELLHRGVRVASHRRSYGRKGTYVTADEHRPKSHRDYGAWPPERMIAWAGSFGRSVALVAEKILARYPHPEMGYRAIFGLVRTAEKHGAVRTDAACARALASAGSWGPTRKHVEAILSRGIEHAAITPPDAHSPPVVHDNVRGASYFDKEEIRDHARDDSETQRHEVAHDGQGADGDPAKRSRQRTLF
jgi:transposase